jgi:hypothetical protein
MQIQSHISKFRSSIVVLATVLVVALSLGAAPNSGRPAPHSGGRISSLRTAAAIAERASVPAPLLVGNRESSSMCARANLQLSDIRPSAAADRSAIVIFEALWRSGCLNQTPSTGHPEGGPALRTKRAGGPGLRTP